MKDAAEGLWLLADELEGRGEYGQAIKCLEAVCQSGASLLPLFEVKTRMRLARLLVDRTHNLSHATAHLERAHLLLKSIPSTIELKCKAYSQLAHCYAMSGGVNQQRMLLNRAVEMVMNAGEAITGAGLWLCNFYSQLANAGVIEGDLQAAGTVLDKGFAISTELEWPELQMFFAAEMLHVQLLQWSDAPAVAKAAQKCDQVWETVHPDRKPHCLGLFFYNELLHTFYLLRICDYKTATEQVSKLDAAVKTDLEQVQMVDELTTELETVKRSLARPDMHHRERTALSQKRDQLKAKLRSVVVGPSVAGNGHAAESSFDDIGNMNWRYKLQLAPPPIDGEWLPRNAIHALVDLIAVMLGRPKGTFKECAQRIQSGLLVVHDELAKLGVTGKVTEVDLKHTAIWTSGLYLTILMQFLENKIAIDITRAEFVDAQKGLKEMIDWFSRFPTILQGCESIIEMLRGQYAHSMGCFEEAVFHFVEASKLTESKSMEIMCQVYAAVSYICIGDAESTSQAQDLIGPNYRIMDSLSGVREKTCIIFVYGLLLMKQENLQESRVRLASGLKIAHQHLGNIQLVSQFLTVLGSLALQVHDTGQAREILRSSLTLAKTLHDVPTQIWVLSVLTDLYKEVGEEANEIENSEYERKKEDDLRKRLKDAKSSSRHLKLIDKARVRVAIDTENESKQAAAAVPSALDIPESVGLATPKPAATSVKRLRETESRLKETESLRRSSRRRN